MIQHIYRNLAEMFLTGRGVEGNVAVVESSQDAIDIAVQRRVGQVVGKSGDSSGRIVAYAGQLAQFVPCTGESAGNAASG